MKKIFLTVLMLLSLTSVVYAEEYPVSSPEIYCYGTSSNGHSAINVIIQNDENILKIAGMSEDELMEEFSATQNDELQIQFDYSIGDDSSWNYQASWEPDRAGFFKCPVSLRVSAKSEFIERKIFDLGYDEYLEILSEYAYKGNNDGWKNVNLYDYEKHPVYIRARFVYTVEDGENGVYHNFISPWSDAVKVSERIKVDEEIASPTLTVISTAEEILENKEVTLLIETNDEIDRAMMQLSHYDGEFDIFISYRTDDGEFISAGLSDEPFRGTKEVTFPVKIAEEPKVLEIMCCLEYDGSEKYDLDAISTFYAEENVIFSVEPGVEDVPQSPSPEKPVTGEDKNSPPIMLYIFPALLIPIIAGVSVMRKKS